MCGVVVYVERLAEHGRPRERLIRFCLVIVFLFGVCQGDTHLATNSVREHALNANVTLGIKKKRRQIFPFPNGQGPKIIDTRRDRRGIAQEKDADSLQNACFPTIVSAAKNGDVRQTVA